jgi:hypothetical protein
MFVFRYEIGLSICEFTRIFLMNLLNFKIYFMLNCKYRYYYFAIIYHRLHNKYLDIIFK